MKIPRFLLFASLIALGLIIIGLLLHTYWVPQTSMTAIVIAILVSLTTGAIAYILNYTGLDSGNQRFIASLVVAMGAKMIIGVIVILIVVVSFKFAIKEYVAAYFFSYFTFTAFEVYGLMRKLRA